MNYHTRNIKTKLSMNYAQRSSNNWSCLKQAKEDAYKKRFEELTQREKDFDRRDYEMRKKEQEMIKKMTEIGGTYLNEVHLHHVNPSMSY